MNDSIRLPLLACLALGLALAGPGSADTAEGEAPELQVANNGYEITVYKSPTCGCCRQWIRHLKSHGFSVLAIDSDDMTAVKDEMGVPRSLSSCHTARVNGYTIEGHVPAADILRLLEEAPRADGLSVPGMPLGSPGMEAGDRVDAHEVVLFTGSDTEVFARYDADSPPPTQPAAAHTDSHDHE